MIKFLLIFMIIILLVIVRLIKKLVFGRTKKNYADLKKEDKFKEFTNHFTLQKKTFKQEIIGNEMI